MEWPDSCPRRKLPASRQVTVIQKKQYALDAGTCVKNAFHGNSLAKLMNFVMRPKVVPPVYRGK